MRLKYSKKYITSNPKLLFDKCAVNLLVINNKFLLFLLSLRKKIYNNNSSSTEQTKSFKASNFKRKNIAFFTVDSYIEEKNYVKLRNDTKIYNSLFEIKTYKSNDNYSILLLESTYNLKGDKRIKGYLYFMIIFIVQRFFIYHIQENVKRSLEVKSLNVDAKGFKT